MTPRLPQPIRAVLEMLRLDQTERQQPQDWNEALDFLDRTQLTLALPAEMAPPEVRRRLERNLADNTERLRRLREASAEIAGRFEAAGVEFVALKGLSHFPDFVADLRRRVQYDLDFYCPPASAGPARDVLLALGYEPITELAAFPMDHLPPMVRKTGWRWRGNYFDPELPPAVDLHFRFWDERTERLAAPGVERFWERRTGHELDLGDRLGYAALHAVRHLLRGSLGLAHVHEIARFLAGRKIDAAFWSRWRELNSPELRRLEAVAFRLAEHYFGAPPVDVTLPPEAEAWFRRYAWSPVEALYRPNKHELYLHLSLVTARRDRWAVVRRRLLPVGLPGPVEAVHTPEQQMTAGLRLRKWAKYWGFVAGRILHHARVLFPTLWGLARR
ncbi:MAG: nucleotidyltransferase family protein [Acidobacteria bacterium]|nr:nucleotidyltransferase family protein [Acidobacteriota bacterium]